MDGWFGGRWQGGRVAGWPDGRIARWSDGRVVGFVVVKCEGYSDVTTSDVMAAKPPIITMLDSRGSSLGGWPPCH